MGGTFGRVNPKQPTTQGIVCDKLCAASGTNLRLESGSMTAIEFNHVTKTYANGTVAVDDLSLGIERGKTTMLVGPSGCGKTTTLRMINRMIEPTSGTITINGVDNATMPATQLRRSIGYVIQNAGLFPHRTVLQNIMTVPRLNGVTPKEAAIQAHKMMDLVGLPQEMARRYPAQLSGGQQQRVGVARALAGEPDVILMDEPFSALDPVVRDELQAEFSRLVRDFGMTVVFVTHDIDEAIKLGDKIAVFEEGGKVAQFASPRELLRNPHSTHVAEFVGLDRGFRALSFKELQLPDDLVLEPVPLANGATRAHLDGEGRFLAWDSEDTRTVHSNAGTIRAGDSLRAALDAVLTSPDGKAALLDEAGRPLGLITLQQLVSCGLLEADSAEVSG